MSLKKIILNENQINKFFITENRESKNINLARRYLKSNGYSQEQANQIVDGIRTDIPNSRIAGCKFLLGVTRMFVNKELNNQQTIANLNQTLKYIGNQTHVNEYNNDLNGENADTIIKRFSKNIEQDVENDKNKLSNITYDKQNNDYEIKLIPSFEEAEKYKQYTSWCVTHDQSMYNSYTNGGIKPFYFLLKHGFEKIPQIEGENTPLDEYGLSMIAISVNENGNLNTCTCRWNHDNDGNDNIMNTEQISNLIGQNFYDVFKPYPQEYVEQKKKEIRQKYESLIEKLNNGSSFDSLFEYVSDLDTNYYIVGVAYTEDDMAIIEKTENGYDYIRKQNGEPLIVVHGTTNIYPHIHHIQTKDDISYIVSTKPWNILYQLDENPYVILPINLSNISQYYQNIISVEYHNNKAEIIDFKRKLKYTFKPYTNNNKIEIKTTTNPNLLKIQIGKNNNQYLNLNDFSVSDKSTEQFQIIRDFKSKNITFSIIKGENNTYNVLNPITNTTIFDSWYNDIKVDDNNNVIILQGQIVDDIYYIIYNIDKFDGKRFELIRNLPSDYIIDYHVDKNDNSIYYITVKLSSLVKVLIQYNMKTNKPLKFSTIPITEQILNFNNNTNKIIYINESTFNKIFNI